LQVAHYLDQFVGGCVQDDGEPEAAFGEAVGKAVAEVFGVDGVLLVVAWTAASTEVPRRIWDSSCSTSRPCRYPA